MRTGLGPEATCCCCCHYHALRRLEPVLKATLLFIAALHSLLKAEASAERRRLEDNVLKARKELADGRREWAEEKSLVMEAVRDAGHRAEIATGEATEAKVVKASWFKPLSSRSSLWEDGTHECRQRRGRASTAPMTSEVTHSSVPLFTQMLMCYLVSVSNAARPYLPQNSPIAAVTSVFRADPCRVARGTPAANAGAGGRAERGGGCAAGLCTHRRAKDR